MCVFSEARKAEISFCVCYLSLSLPLSPQPLESLMHYVVMIIT